MRPGEAEPNHAKESFEDDAQAEFGAAQITFVKNDGNFGDAEPPRLPGSVGSFHHEDVAHREDAVEGQRLERCAPPALEAAGEIGEWHAGYGAYVHTGELA